MDYSLLVGIHDSSRPDEEIPNANSPKRNPLHPIHEDETKLDSIHLNRLPSLQVEVVDESELPQRENYIRLFFAHQHQHQHINNINTSTQSSTHQHINTT